MTNEGPYSDGMDEHDQLREAALHIRSLEPYVIPEADRALVAYALQYAASTIVWSADGAKGEDERRRLIENAERLET